MFDFNQILMENEQILYQCKPNPGKGSKNVGGVLILFALFIMTMVMVFVSNFHIATIIVTLLFGGLAFCTLIYNFFLKKKAISDDLYCLTNMRAIKYEITKQKLTYGYLIKYDRIEVQNEKDGFGDLYMSIVISENISPEQQTESLKNTIFNKNPQDMPFMLFESIERPYSVMEKATKAHKELLINLAINQQKNINKN